MTGYLTLFPGINATLNATTTVLLVTGFLLIRSGRREAHKRAMLAACACSVVFLSSYLYYHAHAGTTRFTGTGWIRTLYFTILGTHTVLAMAVLPLAITTVILGLRGRFDRHRRIARWTFPVWLYVSITGVLVYFFLYQWFPGVRN